MRDHQHRLTLVLLLGVAAVFRLIGLNNISPPGLEHDEVAHWLINRAILDGQHAIYFTEAYGHEAGYHYLQTAFMALLGDNVLALRLPSAFLGILLVAITYTLSHHLFGKQAALITMAFTAVHFYPIFYSRLALRSISLPVLSGLSAYFWWQWWTKGQGRKTITQLPNYPTTHSPLATRHSPLATRYSPLAPLLLSALFAGLSLHTYMAARAVPIFYGLFYLYLALFHWQAFKVRWQGILLFWVIYLVIAAPLLIYLQTNPTAEFRISEIDMPLRELQAGNIRPVLTNSLKIAGMFGFRGDPLWRQYVAGQPLFEPVGAILFYVGVLLTVWRWRDGRYAFLLLWLLVSFAPSIATVDAPSTIRLINLLPIFALVPSLVIHSFNDLSTVSIRLSTTMRQFATILLLIFYAGWTGYSIFIIWPQNEEVQFVWQKALTETAGYLDTAPNSGPVAIGGWSPNTMDPPTMQLTLRRDDLDLRYFGSDSETDPINTLILPQAGPGEDIQIFHPTVRPLAPALQSKLAQWGALPQTEATFTHYTVPSNQLSENSEQSPLSNLPISQSPIIFNNQIQLLGYEYLEQALLTIWQVLAPTSEPRRFFVHALNQAGEIIAQHDGLDAPAVYWQSGDIIVQYHPLPTTNAIATYRLGIYNPDTCPPCQNLRTEDGDEFLLVQP
jgi:4-amino-4-deoxy-L-arabinose transferase-like glycosyltransferase